MKKKHGIAITAGSLLLVLAGTGVVGNSMTAPGLSLNNVNVGTSTVQSASDTIGKDLSQQTIRINDKEFTYDELGISYSTDELSDVLAENKAVNVGSWNSNHGLKVNIDENKLMKTVKEKLPDVFKEPKNADVELKDGSWTAVKGEDGAVPVVSDIEKLVNQRLENSTDDALSYKLKTVKPDITNDVATKYAKKINDMANNAGLYQGSDKKLNITAEQFNSFVKVSQEKNGFALKADETAINKFSKNVPDKVNKKVDNGKAIVDEKGKVLKTLDEWQDGYKFTDVDGLSKNIATQIADGKSSKFKIDGKTTKADVKELFRRVEVDLSAREARTYENDKLVKKYPIAIGKPGTETDKGKFKVFYQTQVQDMGCTAAYDYCTKDVKWISYYNGGEAFHGVWWHNDFGNPSASARSHGCVNMRESDAKEMYYFTQVGTPVHVF